VHLLIVSGVVLPNTPKDVFDKKGFAGVGFDTEGVPIDVLAFYYLNALMPDFTLLIVDEFLRMNQVEEYRVQVGKMRLVDTITHFSAATGTSAKVMLCSDFMSSPEYQRHAAAVKEKIKTKRLEPQLQATVPQAARYTAASREYPVHEIACTAYLAEQGFRVKIGPSKEKDYDSIMAMIGIDISFAYVLDAFALGTKSADSVVHYIPRSRGPNNGQRIYLHDNKHVVKSKLLQGCDKALKYYCTLASIGGRLFDGKYLERGEIEGLRGRRLKGAAIKLVTENITEKYGVGFL
jgi:hypothetical protein